MGAERLSPPRREETGKVAPRVPPPEPTRDLLRAVNEQVRAFAADIDGSAEIDFVCECPNRECFQVVRMTHSEFERVAATPGWYVVCSRHVGQHERVIEETRHYAVVQRENAG
jgi:hypothetical protein